MTEEAQPNLTEPAEADPRSDSEAQSISNTPGARTESAAALAEELSAARMEADTNYDKFLRARADMENYKKRTEREFAELRRTAKKDLLTKLLTVKDNLERALRYGESTSANNESIIEGVRLTQYQLDSLLQAEGVRPIEADGTTFDPRREEAVQRVVDPSVPDHTVVQIVRTGYTFGEDVLRPAQVVVSVQAES